MLNDFYLRKRYTKVGSLDFWKNKLCYAQNLWPKEEVMSQEVVSQHPLCALFSSFLFTVMFMHANLLHLSEP